MSNPDLLSRFEKFNEGKAYADQVKPFGSILVAQDAKMGKDRRVLVAPYDADPGTRERLLWTDLATGEAHKVTTRPSFGGSDAIRIKTYGDVSDEYRVHPESKFLGPDGRPCRPAIRGCLSRGAVEPLFIIHVGKESNRFEEVEAGLGQDGDEVYTSYDCPWEGVRFALNAAPIEEGRRVTGLSRREVLRLRAGTEPRSRERRAAITQQAAEWARERLCEAGLDQCRWLNDSEALLAYRRQMEALQQRLSAIYGELAQLEQELAQDPHSRFQPWHDATECWHQSELLTRYDRASVEKPKGKRSGTAKVRKVEEILRPACKQIGEVLEQFQEGVCAAVHGDKSARRREVETVIRNLDEAMGRGRLTAND